MLFVRVYDTNKSDTEVAGDVTLQKGQRYNQSCSIDTQHLNKHTWRPWQRDDVSTVSIIIVQEGKAVVSRCEDIADWNTRDHLARTIGNAIPCTGCVSRTGHLAHGNNKGEIRGRSRQQNNSMKYGKKEREYNKGEKSQTILN